MAIRIHALRTGSVRVKAAQLSRQPFSALRLLTSRRWSGDLPIYSWLIEHPEGLILIDSGETSRASTRGYFPAWHPYYRLAARFEVGARDEIGALLEQMGIKPDELLALVLTHLHTDHAGGLQHFQSGTVWVSETEWEHARGIAGRMRGYLSHRWPAGFAPHRFRFPASPYGPFAGAIPVTKAEDVIIVPTPGHTPGHVSVIVQIGDIHYFLAGDASYTEHALLERVVDGVTFSPQTTRETLDRILRYAKNTPTVYLPAHDPDAPQRLRDERILMVRGGSGRSGP